MNTTSVKSIEIPRSSSNASAPGGSETSDDGTSSFRTGNSGSKSNKTASERNRSSIETGHIQSDMQSEDRVRETWGTHFDYIASCLSQTIGLGNIWRFPYLVYIYGGGVFFIPYLVGTIFIGIPLFCLETFVGQFASYGPITIWEINLLLKGTGYAVIFLNIITAFDVASVVSISIWYLFASMSGEIPWSTCGNEWNTCRCRVSDNLSVVFEPISLSDGETEDNCTMEDVVNRRTTSDEYYHNYVMGEKGAEYRVGEVNTDLVITSLVTWALIFVFLINGIKSLGKAMYFFSTFPYLILTVFLVRGSTLDSSHDGVEFFLHTDINKILSPRLWFLAISQVFFSTGVCSGNLIGLASYNKFHDEMFFDSFAISILNALTSFYAGFITFSILGFLTTAVGRTVEEVTTPGSGLVFVVYSEAIERMPLPNAWAISFFAMMVSLGLGSLIPSVHCIFAAFEDEFKWLRRSSKRSKIFRATGSVLCFGLNLIWACPEGVRFSDYLDYVSGFPLIIIGLIEVAAFVWIYGLENISEDVSLVVGSSHKTLYFYKYYLKWTWAVFGPLLLIAVLVAGILGFEMPLYEIESHHEWAVPAANVLMVLVVSCVPVWTIVKLIFEVSKKPSHVSARDIFIEFGKPSRKWGPALEQNRLSSRYTTYY